jgi:hypothetical protein
VVKKRNISATQEEQETGKSEVFGRDETGHNPHIN